MESENRKNSCAHYSMKRKDDKKLIKKEFAIKLFSSQFVFDLILPSSNL